MQFFGDQGVAAFLVSALLHDIGHPGNNNDFEVKMMSDLAL